MKTKKIVSGQSLFELVVAVGVVALIVMSVVSLVSNSIQNSSFSKNQSLAARYAEEGTEWLRQQRDTDIDNFFKKVQTAPFTWCLNQEPLTDLASTSHSACGSTVINQTPFIREVKFTITTPSGKTIAIADVKVSWQDAKGTHSVLNSTQFADWRQR